MLFYNNFFPLVIRKMAKGGAGLTLLLEVANLLSLRAEEKMSCREATWKKMKRLPVSAGQIKPNLLSGVKSAWLWHVSTQGNCLTLQKRPPPLLHPHPCTRTGLARAITAPHTSLQLRRQVHAGCTTMALQWEHRL